MTSGRVDWVELFDLVGAIPRTVFSGDLLKMCMTTITGALNIPNLDAALKVVWNHLSALH